MTEHTGPQSIGMGAWRPISFEVAAEIAEMVERSRPHLRPPQPVAPPKEQK